MMIPVIVYACPSLMFQGTQVQSVLRLQHL